MKKALKILIATASLSVANLATAYCTQTGNKVGFMGLDGADGRVYVSVSGHNNQCGCNYIRFKPDATKTDMVLSILMMAKATDNKVRIDINTPEDCNSGSRVYLH